MAVAADQQLLNSSLAAASTKASCPARVNQQKCGRGATPSPGQKQFLKRHLLSVQRNIYFHEYILFKLTRDPKILIDFGEEHWAKAGKQRIYATREHFHLSHFHIIPYDTVRTHHANHRQRHHGPFDTVYISSRQENLFSALA